MNETSIRIRPSQTISCLNIFSIGVDEAFTIRFEEVNVISEERIWFATPNLRLCSSLKKDDKVCTTTFCSEIQINSAAAA